ncbi:HesB/IscA family protein [Calothrix rhizosoleniae]|uniref:HesB/IscA family protein n=1 Tax=Calothrix rhizosoleniae TaxID=888997 RepID=UPI000B497A00|nr:iron-sulfur cluster assembly accessory protein [Calothrix rhizosoleniae]
MIQISPTAAKEIRRLMSQQQISNNCCRLAVKPGGCNDFFYDLSFNNGEIGNSDSAFDCDDIQVIIDSESLNYVKDLKLDYSEDLMGGAFRFYNPQANVTCGCGNSFSLKQEG